MWQQLLDFFFPRLSLTGSEGEWMTDREFSALRSWPVIVEAAALRERGVRSLDRIVAASSYEASPLLRMAVQRFKYRRIPALQRELGSLLVSASGLLASDDDVVLCPVPLHWTRKFQRGFNQSQLLADIIAQTRGWRVSHLLSRVRPTGHQARRNRKQRMIAVKNAFACIVRDVPERVVLIDDISTTGATLDACAHALKKCGARRVDALVVAVG